MPNDYITAYELQGELPDRDWDPVYDNLFTEIATQASRALDVFCMRRPGSFYSDTDETFYFQGDGTDQLWIGPGLADEPTSVSVAESGDIDGAAASGGTYTAWATSDYILWPYNAMLDGEPYLRIDVERLNGTKVYFPKYPKGVKIVGKFGYSTTVPGPIKKATLIQGVRWFKRAQQAYADTGAIFELGQLTYVRELDPDVKNMVMHYRKMHV